MLHAGIVDQDIDGPERILCRRNEGADLLRPPMSAPE